MTRAFLLFSGHNDRAVVALCRFFDQASLPFVIAAAGQQDAIHRTSWASRVLLNRPDAVVNLALFQALIKAHGGPLIYVPTTEFINAFVLSNRVALQAMGLEIGLPDQAIYEALTGKHSSQSVLTKMCTSLRLPAAQDIQTPRAPCVLKPRENVAGGRVWYPLLCRSPAELDQVLTGLDRSAYFAQDFIIGQSHYLCAYLARDGRTASFWQTNLMQQPGGKSIVLARSGANPGLDEATLMRALLDWGYHGPFMMEVIQADTGLFYIEVNPRFWGPLQLALDVCPQILALYAHDHGFEVATPAALPADQAWYAWAHGAALPGCVLHPAAQALLPAQIARQLASHDVYARADTQALHAVH